MLPCVVARFREQNQLRRLTAVSYKHGCRGDAHKNHNSHESLQQATKQGARDQIGEFCDYAFG